MKSISIIAATTVFAAGSNMQLTDRPKMNE